MKKADHRDMFRVAGCQLLWYLLIPVFCSCETPDNTQQDPDGP
jgi:hypothetical protein